MKTKLAILSALLCASLSARAATTTTYYFCTTGTVSYTDNIAASVDAGWRFTTTANGDKQENGIYTYPVKFTSGRIATAPYCSNSDYITEINVGARVSNTARTIEITPIYENGTKGTKQKTALTSTSLETATIEFDISEKIVSFDLTFTVSGNSTAYLFYTTITTESSGSSGGGGDEPPGPVALAVPAGLSASEVDDSGFSLAWEPVENADGYSVEVLDSNGIAVGSVVFDSTTATVTGLSSDSTYTVKVKALAPAGSEDYDDSDWSAPISVETALAGGLRKAALFKDTFDSVSGTGWDKTGTITDTDESGWVFGGNAYRGPKGIRLGSTSNPGVATTREIALTNNMEAAEMTISFLAAAYTGKTTSGTLTLSNTLSGATTVLTNLNPSAMSNAAADPLAGGTAYSFRSTVPACFTLRFESLSTASDKRLMLDSIKVTQIYNPNLNPLAAPVPVFTNATQTALQASWPAVAGAAGYAVELRDASGVRIVYDTTLPSSALGFDFGNLDWDSAYTLRVKAIGDGSETCNSPWSESVSGRTLRNLLAPDFTASADSSAAVMAVVSNKTFSVAAERDGEPLEVAFAGLSPAASGTAPTFANGTFAWTPATGDEGKDFTATFTTDAGTYSTNIVFAVLARPALAAPTVEITSAPTAENFSASFAWNDQIRADSYSVRLWRDTADYTKAGVCFENFFDKHIPAGWGAEGTEWYDTYDNARMKFDKNATLTTRRFPAAVTNLAFHLRSSSTTATSSWTLFASAGSTNEADWVSITNSAARTGDVSLDFSKGSGYRRFKWRFQFVKSGGTLGLGNISFAYDEAGPKFKSGFGSVSEAVSVGNARTIEVSSLKPDSEYFLEVTVAGDAGTAESTVVRFATPHASPAMVMVFR